MKKRLASRRQIEHVTKLLASGRIPHREAQRLIITHDPQGSLTERMLAAKSADEASGLWEDRFPGKGAALMGILGPFYGWKPQLKPALPDLMARAKIAVFWMRNVPIKVFSRTARHRLRVGLAKFVTDTLQASYLHEPVHELWAGPQDLLEEAIEGLLPPSFQGYVRHSLSKTLFIPCAFILVGQPEEAAKFRPLIDLWLAGNFPVGFDGENPWEGNLLVLVAD